MNENGWASRFRVYVRPLLRHTAKIAPAKRTTTTIPSTTYMRPGTETLEGKGAAGAACASGKVTTPACASVPVPAEYSQAARSRPFRIERPHRAVMLQALIFLSNWQDIYLAASPSRTEVRNSGVARILGSPLRAAWTGRSRRLIGSSDGLLNPADQSHFGNDG